MSRARPTIRDLDGLPDLRDDATRRRSAIDLFVGKLHGAHLAFDKIGRPALTEEEARVALITLDALYRRSSPGVQLWLGEHWHRRICFH